MDALCSSGGNQTAFFYCSSDSLECNFTTLIKNKHAVDIVILCGTASFCVLRYKLQDLSFVYGCPQIYEAKMAHCELEDDQCVVRDGSQTLT